ncbi:MAG: galactokinase [Spirochaetaceae bacterium]|nr:galactokinase [Spirochaetaceae bacterium]
MKIQEWRRFIDGEAGEALFLALYGDEVEAQRTRCRKLLDKTERFADGSADGGTSVDVRLFTAAGRTELGGNHTDHNGGKVLAASVQLDAAAFAFPCSGGKVEFHSTGFPDIIIDISDLSPQSAERGKPEALLRGVAAGIAAQGIPVGGFCAVADNTVFAGSGLSSSAALEVLAAKIFDGLYGYVSRQSPKREPLSPLCLAQIAQKAENVYYGKPSGLMDQAASAFGGAVAIDFADALAPIVQKIDFDPGRAGYVLCVVNTGGSHAGLTGDYAAVPEEMRRVAAFFGKDALSKVESGEFYAAIDTGSAVKLREACGDRAILRALHFFAENERVDAMCAALNSMNTAPGKKELCGHFSKFLDYVNESGISSWELLQNCCPPAAPESQGICLALALTRRFAFTAPTAPKIACRVHGGGFAGSIQTYIHSGHFDAYKQYMETIFGANAVTKLSVRAVGAAELPRLSKLTSGKTD